MATRLFPDRDGAEWRVWSTVPQDARGCLPGFENGWLTFERVSSGERRRLAPIPGDWEQVAHDRLLLWCRVAQPVRSVGAATGAPTAGAQTESSPTPEGTMAVPEMSARADQAVTRR